MSLVDYCSYLKQEIYQLQSQLRAALEERDLFERLLKEEEEEEEEEDETMPDSHVPQQAISYWNWLRGASDAKED